MSKLNYNIIAEIKKSNKGNVYLATMEGYDFPVVVKELKHGNVSVYQTLQAVNSEHLPRIYHVEEIENGIFIAEEYIEGELLAEYVSSQKLTEVGCLDIAEQMCQTLKVLHSHQPPIVHRDIKPSNLIISSKGIVKVIDFDSSRFYKAEVDSDTRLLGTEKYAPPEQYGFSQTDCRSDIYSMGVVFDKFTVFISKGKKNQWKRMVEKCTLFAPDSRYQSVDEIEQELKKIQKMRFFNLKKLVIVAGVIVFGVMAGFVWREFSKLNAQIDELLVIQEQMANENADDLAENETIVEDETSKENAEENNTEKNTEEETIISAMEEESLDEKYYSIQPEFRDLETDIPAYVSLKEHIRENHSVVMYCFKDRMKERNFLINAKQLDYETIKFHGMKLYSQKDGYGTYIDEKYVKVQDNIIIIDREYMNLLESGYYMLAMVMSYGDDAPFEHGVYLYVAESDILEEPKLWLQNTTYDYSGGENEEIHLVLKNDSSKKMISLQLENGSEIDSSMYTILQDGRGLEISGELLKHLKKGGLLNYNVICEDGSALTICINGVSNSN